MKDLKIGALVITKKALLLILLALFIDGIIFGAFVASNLLYGKSINIIVLLVLLLMPFIILYKPISKNIHETN